MQKPSMVANASRQKCFVGASLLICLVFLANTAHAQTQSSNATVRNAADINHGSVIAELQSAASKADREHGQQSAEYATALADLAAQYRDLSRATEAEPLERRVLALRTKVLGEKHPDTLSSLNSLTFDLRALSRASEAEPLDRKALALRTEVLGEKHPNTINSLNSLAFDLRALDRVPEAESLDRRALALRTEVLGEKHPDTLQSLNSLGADFRRQNRPGEAELLDRRALALRTEVLGEKHPDTLYSLSNLGQDLAQMGQLKEAERLSRLALTLRIAVLGEKHPDTLWSLDRLGFVLWRMGRAAEAEQLLRRAVALRIEVLGQKHRFTVASLNNLALALLAQPSRAHLAVGLVANSIALSGDRSDLGNYNPREEAQQSRDAESTRSIYALFANAAWAADRATSSGAPTRASLSVDLDRIAEVRRAAFAALQEVMTDTTTEAVALQAARRAAQSAGLEPLAIERQRLTNEWRANDFAQSQALGEGRSEGQTRLAALQDRATDLEAALDAINKKLQVKAPDYFDLIRPQALDLPTAKRLLAADEAVLMIVPTGLGTHVMALTRDGLLWTRARMKQYEVATLVRSIRSDMSSELRRLGNNVTAGLDPGLGRYDRRAAYALYRELVEPVASALVGKRELFIAAAHDLASLPFGLLVTAPPTGADDSATDLRSTPWLADRFAITQLPSLQSLSFLRVLRRREAGSNDSPFAGFGDPKLAADPESALRSARQHGTRGHGDAPTVTSLIQPGQARSGGVIADVESIRRLESMPGTAIELARVAEAMGADQTALWLQERDTETAVRTQDLSRVRILSIATHGFLAGDAGVAEPGLVFTPPAVATEDDDGLLTASEVTTLRLNADWVILSACNTAGPGGKGEPGLSGLARAFFYAGGRSLLASHWPVRDDVAPDLIVTTLRAREENPKMSKAEALTTAMAAIRNDKSDPSRAHPSAWAPFSLIGENR